MGAGLPAGGSMIRAGGMGIRATIENMSPGQLLLTVLLAACAALVPAWLNYDIISRDGASQYIPTAMLFYEGRFLAALQESTLPLFPFLIAVVAKVTTLDFETSGRLIAVFSLALAAAGMYRVADEIYENRWVSLLAVLFLVTNGDLVMRSVDCLKESLLVCFILWGNYFILRQGRSGRKWLHLGMGTLLLVLGAMVRSTALLFLGAWLLLWVFHKRQGIAVRMLVPAIPVVAVIVLWLVDPSLPVFRKSFSLGKFVNAFPVFRVMVENIAGIIGTFFKTGNPLLILLGCWGLYASRKNSYSVHWCIVASIFFLLLVRMQWTTDRYLLALVVWMYPLAACTAVEVLQSKQKVGRIVVWCALISAVAGWAVTSFRPPSDDRVARREAGAFILAELGPGQRVITNRDRLAFYAQGQSLALENILVLPDTGVCYAIDTEKEGLIGNLGFETGGLAGWIVSRYADSTYACVIDESEKYMGRSSLRMTQHQRPGSRGGLEFDIPFLVLQPGETYRLSAWFKGRDVQGGAAGVRQLCFLVKYDGQKENERVWLEVPEGTYDWTSVCAGFSIPPGVQEARLCPDKPLGFTGTLWLDDVQLDGGNAPLAGTDTIPLLIDRLDGMGRRPDKVVRSIYVYLPRS